MNAYGVSLVSYIEEDDDNIIQDEKSDPITLEPFKIANHLTCVH